MTDYLKCLFIVAGGLVSGATLAAAAPISLAAQAVDNRGADGIAEQLRAADWDQQIHIPLASGETAALRVIRRIELDGIVALTLQAQRFERPLSVIVVGRDDQLKGRVATGPDTVFDLRKRPGQLLTLTATDAALDVPAHAFDNDMRVAPSGTSANLRGLMPRAEPASGKIATAAAATPSAVSIIDLLATYSDGFAEAFGGNDDGAKAEILLRVEASNAMFADSLIDAEVRIVGFYRNPFSDEGDNGPIIGNTAFPTSANISTTDRLAIFRIHQLRAELGADMVGIFRSFRAGQGSCGLGFLNGEPGLGTIAKSRYAGFFLDSCGAFATVHELGHVLGQAHDRSLSPALVPVHPYAFGYTTDVPDGGFFTIMAGSGPGRTFMPYFSNPQIVACKGVPCGVENSEDSARSMRSTAPEAAVWMPDSSLGDSNLGDRLVPRNSGILRANVSIATALTDARYEVTELGPTLDWDNRVFADATPAEHFDGGGTFTRNFQVPANLGSQAQRYRMVVTVETDAPGKAEAYVYLDNPLATPPTCAQTPDATLARCQLDFVQPPGAAERTVWSFGHVPTAATAEDGTVRLRYQDFFLPLSPAGPGSGIALTGPKQWPDTSQPLPLRLSWNNEHIYAGERRAGLAQVRATPNAEPIEIPFVLERSWWFASSPIALLPGADSGLNRLPNIEKYSTAHIEIAPNVKRVRFAVHYPTNLNPDFLRWFAVPPAAGSTDQAGNQWPFVEQLSDEAITSGIALERGTDSTDSVIVEGADLRPGRWRLGQGADGGGPFPTSFSVEILDADPTPNFRPGHYFNPARSGHGLFLDHADNQWIAVWYTYLEDGSPTWYFMQTGEPRPGEPIVAPIQRFGWNGNTTDGGTQVGMAVITPTADEQLTLAYDLEGHSGSERLTRLGAGGCLGVGGQSLDASGHWFSPTRPGFGYSVQYDAGSSQEIYVIYLYDQHGLPRWLFAQGPFGSGEQGIDLLQLTGFCPGCDASAIGSRVVGQLNRSLGSAEPDGLLGPTRIAINATLAAPLSGNWNTDLSTALLSSRKHCK
ncbi:MAG: M12 family metallo-peptidase [Xanthomonadaceae bacterium]|nr:M12 family metallo-peptidase [Xanthomonadaceae bacterium]